MLESVAPLVAGLLVKLHVGAVTYAVNVLYLRALASEQFGEDAWR